MDSSAGKVGRRQIKAIVHFPSPQRRWSPERVDRSQQNIPLESDYDKLVTWSRSG